MTNYLKNALTPASQREQAHADQVKNSAGGYSFQLTDWQRLDRFLILGTEGGSYYAKERKLTRDNMAAVERCIKADGARTVNRIVEISDAGRAVKNDPAILALALACRAGDEATRRAAYEALPKVCRIGTHLYHFVQFADQLGGWGRGMRRAVASWFNSKTTDDLAYQLVKYQQRDGWSARDLLRLAHAKPADEAHSSLYKYVTQGYDDVIADGTMLPPIVGAVEELKTSSDMKRIVKLIQDYKVPREAVPTQHLNDVRVWEALLPHMGVTAMIRNLATMTRVGLLAPASDALLKVCEDIQSAERLKKGRVHPIQLLSAMLTYRQGRGMLGSNTWSPITQVVDALDAAFYTSFGNVEPSGKRTLLALDVSGSMSSGMCGGVMGLTPRIGSVAMAMVTAAVETKSHAVGFSTTLCNLAISPKRRLDDNIEAVSRLPFAGTDCSLPMVWAQKHGHDFDTFIVYTDSETWAGAVHPHTALEQYRQKRGIAAKLIVVGMLANEFTIANPNDAGMLDVVGFDTATPQAMTEFSRSE